ncbi:MAG: methyltransferase family protein [Actinomycetota bacterium]
MVNIWSFEVLFYSLNLDFKIFRFPFSIKLFDNLTLKVLGFFLVCSGFTFFIWALINLGNSWRLGIDDKKPGKLIMGGIYRFSRHPIYLFFNLYFLGTFLIWGNLIFLIFWIIITLMLHYQIIQEEKFLIKLHRQKYLKYMDSVGRYITFKTNFGQPEYLDK